MRKFKKINLFFILVTVCFLIQGYAKTIAIGDLLANPDEFNKKYVTVKGEVIGDKIKVGLGLWINISSEGKDIGVFCPDKNMANSIKYLGSYKQIGDIIEVSGIFYKKCPLHGERDIHAKKITIVKRGKYVRETLSPFKVKLALILFIICVVLSLIYLYRQRARRKKE